MKKITLFLVAIFAMNLFSFAQSQMSGTYTVGTGGSYDYSSMAEAGMAIKSAEFTGDVTLLICTDLTEAINTGIVNKSEYKLTIRPDKDEARTITYTTATGNTGPTGVFVIGGNMTKTPGSTIGWASIPTKNVVIDGAAEGQSTPRLKITNGKWGTNVLLYGDVQDVVVKNCILVSTAAASSNYALTFRSENYSSTSKDIGPKNCLVENCILESTHATTSQAVLFQGNQANSAAGYPANITIRNCDIKAHVRGMYVRQVKNLTVEGCTFDLSDAASGILAHGILGEKVVGTAIVRGNKFVKNSTKNFYGGSYGLQTITASGGADVWVIENNYFAGYDALSSITNTTNGTEGRLVAVRCGDSCVVRHNTFHMPKLTKTPASALVGSQPTALLWLAGSKQYPVQNNIFICEETTANVSLIRGGLNPNVTGNVFFHNGGKAAIVAAAPSCMTFADLETSYPAQAATSKWTNVTFTDAANCDLSLAGSSDGDINLAVDRLDDVLTDIEGTERGEKTYAGAYEGTHFQYTVVALTNDENKGTVSGAGAYYYGTEVTLTATPKPGYKLLYWSDRSTENPRNITMTKNEALSAYFVKEYVVEPTFTIEKVWENTNVPASTNNGHQAVGWDGKIYMKDRLNAAINVYTETGSELYARLGSTVTDDSAGDQPIAVDEAGNLIVRSGSSLFYNSPTQISIFRKDEITPKVINFELPVTGRCDFISASGNIFSAEGGYVYFYCQNTTVVNRVKITNGAATAADVTVDVVGDNITAGNTQNHVMVDIFGNLAAHSRSNAVDAINIHTGETTAFNNSLSDIKLSTLGGCSFELGGKEFWAYNVGTTNYNSEWNIYNMTDGAFLSDTALYAKNKTDKNSAANWLNVQVVDEKTAYIYQFCPKVAVAVWKVTMQEVVLRDTENNEELLNALNSKTTNVSVYRSLKAGMYNTLCVPFDVNDLTGTPLENATVWQYNGATVENEATHKEIFLNFEEVNAIKAGKPYLVEPAEDIAAPMEFKNVTISTTDGSNVAQGAVTMHGILHPTELQANDKSILFLVENNNLAWANETANMNGMRAYFKVNDKSLLSARTRAYIRREPTVTTDMENITTTETEIKKVIYNNNLYILRGEEVYTIQGNRIK